MGCQTSKPRENAQQKILRKENSIENCENFGFQGATISKVIMVSPNTSTLTDHLANPHKAKSKDSSVDVPEKQGIKQERSKAKKECELPGTGRREDQTSWKTHPQVHESSEDDDIFATTVNIERMGQDTALHQSHSNADLDSDSDLDLGASLVVKSEEGEANSKSESKVLSELRPNPVECDENKFRKFRSGAKAVQGAKFLSQKSGENHISHPRRIGQYMVSGTLGAGSFGKVRLVSHVDTGKLFAMKTVNKSVANRAKLQEMGGMHDVLREVAIMKKLNHPNVIKFVEVLDDPTQDKLYIVLEYMEKGPLLGNCMTCQPFSEDSTRKIFRQVSFLLLIFFHPSC